MKTEFNAPFEKILTRKLKEELGPAKYVLGKPIVFMSQQWKEKMFAGRNTARIFAVAYEAKYKRGAIRLSPRHTEFKWVSVKNLNPKKYFRDGWLKGVKNYLKLNQQK